jgi:hypothetical protein
MGAIKGRLAELWSSAGTTTTLTKEACEQVSGNIYHVTNAARRYLDPMTTVLVYDNDVLQTTGYTIWGGCQIHFASAPTTPITLSGKCYTPAEVTLVTDWELNLSSEVYDCTAIGATARAKIPSGVLDWKGSFNRYYEDNTWEAKAAANATKRIIRCFSDQSAGYCWTGWVALTGHTQTVPVDGLETESVEFEGDGMIAYTTDET